MKLSTSFWRGRRVLVTGHTGFKGAWLTIWLHQLGAQVCGYSLKPETTPNLFDAGQTDDLCWHVTGDIRDEQHLQRVVSEFKPEVVFHLAAQALVRKSYVLPAYTFDTNVMGTVNLLDALRKCPDTRVIIAVTTDKVYRNPENGIAFVENDPLGGEDPYSASKAATEIAIESYRRSFFSFAGVGLVSARAGNVIGGGDWSLDRIIPDAVRAWQAKEVLTLRHPLAVRPWQHVVEPIYAYLYVAQTVYDEPALADTYNFGPASQSMITVGELIQMASEHIEYGEFKVENQSVQPHEAQLLRLDTSKASRVFGLQPIWDVSTTICRTMSWYRQVNKLTKSVRQMCLDDINAYCRDAEAT